MDRMLTQLQQTIDDLRQAMAAQLCRHRLHSIEVTKAEWRCPSNNIEVYRCTLSLSAGSTLLQEVPAADMRMRCAALQRRYDAPAAHQAPAVFRAALWRI